MVFPDGENEKISGTSLGIKVKNCRFSYEDKVDFQ